MSSDDEYVPPKENADRVVNRYCSVCHEPLVEIWRWTYGDDHERGVMMLMKTHCTECGLLYIAGGGLDDDASDNP